MSIDIGKVSVPIDDSNGELHIDPKRIRADILSGQFDEISVTSNERRVNPEVVQIPLTLTSQEEIIGLLALKGDKGTSIASITKTGTSGRVDTYTILMTDGSTATFEVTNGEKGDPGSSIASITKTGTSGLVDTYTILLTDGSTSTFTVTNGSGGYWGGITGTLSDQTDLQSVLTAINARIDNLNDFTIHVCTSGEYDPTTYEPTIQNPSENVFYLVPSGTAPDVFTEWIYVNSSWEIFGSASVDLSNYVTDTQLQTALSGKANTADLGDLAEKDKVNWNTDIDNIPNSFPPSSHTHPYLPLSGGTLTGNLFISDSTGTQFRQLKILNGDVNCAWIAYGASGGNPAYMEIASGYGGNNPIYVRQYVQGASLRTLTLFDENGNTTVPKTLLVKGSWDMRPADPDRPATGTGGIYMFKASSNMTLHKPSVGDGHILGFEWDNTGGYDSQLFLANTTGEMMVRGMTQGTWNGWRRILDSSNYTSYAASANHTHNYAGSSSAGGAANSLANFTVNKSTGQDANNVIYAAHTYYTSNGPATSLGASTNDGALYSQAYSDNWVAQIAQDYRNGNLFTRGKNNGTWQAWKAVSYSDTKYPIYIDKVLDANYESKFRTETKGNTSNGSYIGTIRTNTGSIGGLPTYSAGLSYGMSDCHGYLMPGYNSKEFWVGGGNADKLNWKANLMLQITNITRSGTTFTATRADGTTFTFTQQDSDTKYSAGTGLGLSGTSFYLPIPRVAESCNALPGGASVRFREYTAGANYGLPSNHWYQILEIRSTDTNYGTQLALGMTVDAAYYRKYSSAAWGSWKSLINTWRGIQDNLTSTASDQSLSAKQGKELNENKQSKLQTKTITGTTNAQGSLALSGIATTNTVVSVVCTSKEDAKCFAWLYNNTTWFTDCRRWYDDYRYVNTSITVVVRYF